MAGTKNTVLLITAQSGQERRFTHEHALAVLQLQRERKLKGNVWTLPAETDWQFTQDGELIKHTSTGTSKRRSKK